MTVLFHHSGATETRCSSDRRDRQEHAGAAPAVHTDRCSCHRNCSYIGGNPRSQRSWTRGPRLARRAARRPGPSVRYPTRARTA